MRPNIEPDFTIEELSKCVRSLKNGKSKDMMGLVNEVIKHGRTSFQESLLNLLKKIKNDRTIPIVWNNILIPLIDKKKGSKKLLKNKRGIFITSKNDKKIE